MLPKHVVVFRRRLDCSSANEASCVFLVCSAVSENLRSQILPRLACPLVERKLGKSYCYGGDMMSSASIRGAVRQEPEGVLRRGHCYCVLLQSTSTKVGSW